MISGLDNPYVLQVLCYSIVRLRNYNPPRIKMETRTLPQVGYHIPAVSASFRLPHIIAGVAYLSYESLTNDAELLL